MNSSARFIVQNFVNMYINKKAFKYFVRPQKAKQRTFKNILLFVIFAFFLIGVNQAIYFLTSPANLFTVVGAYRKMSAAQIKSQIERQSIEIMTNQRQKQQVRISLVKKLGEIEKILTHSARRVTYDTFGIIQPSHAWAFTQPQFITSMIIQSSVFYVICLFMNLISNDRKQLQNAFGVKVVGIIIIFITQIQLLIHTQQRLIHHPDLFDYIFPAFTINQRRQVMKILVIPMMILIQNMYLLFLETEAEHKLKELTMWIKPDEFIQIRSKLKAIQSNNNPHLQQNVQVALKELEIKLNEQSKKCKDEVDKQRLRKEIQRIEIFKLERSIIIKLLVLEASNIFRDEAFLNIKNDYKLPFN